MDNKIEFDFEIFFDRAKKYIKDLRRIKKAIKLTSLRVLKPINKRLIEKYIDVVECMQESLLTGTITTELLEEYKEELDKDKKRIADAVIFAVCVKETYIGMQELDKSLYETKREMDKFKITSKYSKKDIKASCKNIDETRKKAAKEVKKFNKKNPGVLKEFEESLEELPSEIQDAMFEENPEMFRMVILNKLAGNHES